MVLVERYIIRFVLGREQTHGIDTAVVDDAVDLVMFGRLQDIPGADDTAGDDVFAGSSAHEGGEVGNGIALGHFFFDGFGVEDVVTVGDIVAGDGVAGFFELALDYGADAACVAGEKNVYRIILPLLE